LDPSGDSSSQFGQHILVSDDKVFITALTGDGGNGIVYVFDHSYAYLNEFKASDGTGGDLFGQRVSLLGDKLFIGARKHNGEGAVYVFSIASGLQTSKIQASDKSTAEAAGQTFGSGIAVTSTVLVIGAMDRRTNKGGLYILDPTTFQEQVIIEGNSFGLSNPNIGFKISIAGQRMYCRANEHDNDRGALLILDLSGTHILTLFGENRGDSFSMGYSIKDDQLYVGATGFGNTGKGYIYTLDDPNTMTSATLDQELLPDESGLDFGLRTFLTTDYIYISGQQGVGVVYRYARDGTPMGKTFEPEGRSGNKFGSFMGGNDDMLIVGAKKSTRSYILNPNIFV